MNTREIGGFVSPAQEHDWELIQPGDFVPIAQRFNGGNLAWPTKTMWLCVGRWSEDVHEFVLMFSNIGFKKIRI